MSSSIRLKTEKLYDFRSTRTLWHEPDRVPEALGCSHCVLHPTCGGLNVQAGLFDCKIFCQCRNPGTCDRVCTGHPERFARAMREVRGLEFDNIPVSPQLAPVNLPSYIPLLDHAHTRLENLLDLPWVALPLSALIRGRDGHIAFDTPEAIRAKYKLSARTKIVLSGVDRDPALERWWGALDRRESIRALMRLGISLVSTPNYSVFSDEPRPDNLFNQKRIVIACEEFISEGLPCALHLNARTQRDYERFAAHLAIHPEIEYVAFEFSTGAGYGRRVDFHLAELQRLTERAGRPLRLVLRGAVNELSRLMSHFQSIHFIDTDAFVKTQHRQRWVFDANTGAMATEKRPTSKGAPIDDLLLSNIQVRSDFIHRKLIAKVSLVESDTPRSQETPAEMFGQ